MIENLQHLLLGSGYINNEAVDKIARYEINTFLQKSLASNETKNVITAVEIFIEKFNQRKGNVIKNKSAYFVKVVNDLLAELDVPDIEFKAGKATKQEIKEAIFKIIEYATIPENWQMAENCTNPIHDSEWQTNCFYTINDDAYEKAITIMKNHKDYYSPLIEKLLALNYITDASQSIKSELDDIYEKLEKGVTLHV